MENLLFVLVHVAMAIPGALHALLFKRNPRSALGWVFVCLMFPMAGPLLYFLFGINRIRTRARKLQADSPFQIDRPQDEPGLMAFQIPPPLDEIARMSGAIVRRPLICGNRIEMLRNGEQAYPSMLSAIETAREQVFLSSYIFETNRTGRQFIERLAAAKTRGVDVRVIIDGVGEWYSVPRAGTLLAREGVRVVRFLPPKLFPPIFRINLRNHRKLLVIDGRESYLGGMNIGDRHLAEETANPNRVVDLHFKVTGPVVRQLEQVFLEDWQFSSREKPMITPRPFETTGRTICRAVVDGPNVKIDRLYMILVCAVSSARHSVSVMTPYFLPSPELIAALQAASLRGVAVTVLLPEKNNLPVVKWASMNLLPDLLEYGVRVFFQPPPFVHTKLIIVDNHYVQIGSANLDPRSLFLNFELMVEIYGRSVAQSLFDHFESCKRLSREVTLRDMQERSLGVRLRDAAACLFTPYL